MDNVNNKTGWRASVWPHPRTGGRSSRTRGSRYTHIHCIHITTAASRTCAIYTFTRTPTRKQTQKYHQAFARRLPALLPGMAPRALANTVHGLAKLRCARFWIMIYFVSTYYMFPLPWHGFGWVFIVCVLVSSRSFYLTNCLWEHHTTIHTGTTPTPPSCAPWAS